MRTTHSRRLGALSIAAAAGLALFGCASTSDDASADQSVTAAAQQAETVQAADLWVKAADEGMTAAFGTLTNTGDKSVRVVGVASDVATDVQLHETFEDETGQMVMQQVEGFDIAPGGTLTLAPGGNHIMIMGMAGAIAAGDEVTFTLSFDDGSTVDIVAVAKAFEGANETYNDDDSDMGDTDMGDMGTSESPRPADGDTE